MVLGPVVARSRLEPWERLKSMFGIGYLARRVGFIFCCLAIAASAQILVRPAGARQFGMGKGGVALPDGAHGADFNPALPALAFPWDKVSVELSPDWMPILDRGDVRIRQREWNGPFTGTADMGPAYEALFRIPSLYLPRLGYIGFGQSEFAIDMFGLDRVRVYALTLAPAVDFLGEDEGRSSPLAWSMGLTLKGYGRESDYPDDKPPLRFSASGFAFDLGAAGRTLLGALPGARLDWGFAFANLGPPVATDIGGTAYFDALEMRYRAGYALSYEPFRGKRFPFFRIILQQDFCKPFYGYDGQGEPYPFYIAFFKDMDVPLSRYWREMESHTGLETTWFGLASLRLGRSMDESYGAHPWYTFGYGLDSGPLLGPGYIRFDYGRELKTREGHESSYPLLREYGLQAGWRF